jgi:hypothetical protein
MVIRMAMTPSLNASIRPLLMAQSDIRRCNAHASSRVGPRLVLVSCGLGVVGTEGDEFADDQRRPGLRGEAVGGCRVVALQDAENGYGLTGS